MPQTPEPKLISGNANMPLAKAIARRMSLHRGVNVGLVDARVERFNDGEIFVEVFERLGPIKQRLKLLFVPDVFFAYARQGYSQLQLVTNPLGNLCHRINKSAGQRSRATNHPNKRV